MGQLHNAGGSQIAWATFEAYFCWEFNFFYWISLAQNIAFNTCFIHKWSEFLAGCSILEDLYAHDIEFLTDYESSFYGQEFKSLTLSKLTTANIAGYHYFPVNPFSNVKFLGLEIKQVHHDFPSFHNLTQLELLIELDKSQLLAEMLKHCPKLQSLSLQVREEDWMRGPENWADPDFVPECLLLNLKTCSFRYFEDLEVELQLARYILKNARVLQTMKILTGPAISRRQIKMIREKSSSSKLSPSRCQIIAHPMYSHQRS
ncbi:putative F-box/FBD/LRR-repeat protein At4g13965 [Lotus japonicus]|uniref:putative F-box/FBD/LRR-repeat protein At4g13965 n=1 Tax=Lotus japonicus TaxID=34305 RepID=UPI0025897C01|nr:putative F-box/FBD/LRR-repeat protein At4g13965 [Lotus japonicus]